MWIRPAREHEDGAVHQLQAHGIACAVLPLGTDRRGFDGVALAAGFFDGDLVVPQCRPVAGPAQAAELLGVLFMLTTPAGLLELHLLQGLPGIGPSGLSLLGVEAGHCQSREDGHQGQCDHHFAECPA